MPEGQGIGKRDRAKERWDDYYDEHQIPLPPGIDNPTCPRGNAMCKGTPNKPSGVISDQQGIDNQGLADRINKSAGTSGSRVLGKTTKAGDESIFERIGTGSGLGDGSRSTRNDPSGGDTPMTMEELWKFLKENKVEIGHTVLDLIGLIPVYGEIADIANAAWYAAQGDYTMAGISIASAVPGLGWGGTAGKWSAKYGDEAIGAARAGRGGCKCFPAGTLIATETGDIPIEEVEVGDRIWARNLVTGRSELRRVSSLFNKRTDELMTLTVADEQVTVTSEHPFYVTGRGWVESSDLKVGDKLEQRDRTSVSIERIDRRATRAIVYNLTVDQDRNFYVGRSELLVHNCRPLNLSPPGAGRGGALNAAKRHAGIPPARARVGFFRTVIAAVNPSQGGSTNSRYAHLAVG